MPPSDQKSPKAPPSLPRRSTLRAGTVAVVGRPNVGKSTLLNALLGEPIAITSRHPQTTRDRILGVLSIPGHQYVFVDTPGIHVARTRLGTRMNAEAREASQSADVVVFVTDVRSTRPLGPAKPDQQILNSLPDRPKILVLNKIDRLVDKGALLPALQLWGAAHNFSAIVPVSARRKDGVDNILRAIAPLFHECEPLYEPDVLTDRPTHFFATEFVREQILQKTQEEVPHGVAVVLERFDEIPRVPVIELAVWVDKESHKRILIGHKGSMLKAIGTDARARIEALYGKKIHLQLWVRVRPRWYENDTVLNELGYGQAPAS